MTIRQSLFGQFVLFLLCAIYSASVASSLPETVPIHWNINGQVDGYGSKWVSLGMGPGLVALMMLMTLGLPKLSPRNFTIDRFEKTYAYTTLLIAGLMVCIHVIVLRATLGAHMDIGRVFMVVLFLFFALIGNVLGRVKQNFYMGIRTPWTLASEKVWDATHRLAGKFWFFGGIAGAIAAALGTPMAANIVFLLGITLWPVVESYRLYRSLDAKGQL